MKPGTQTDFLNFSFSHTLDNLFVFTAAVSYDLPVLAIDNY